MDQSEYGAMPGQGYEKEWRVGVTNYTMEFSRNSIATGQCTFICLRHLVLRNGFSKITVHLSGPDIWLRLRLWKTAEGRSPMSQSTWQKRLVSLTGLRISIGIDTQDNGLMLRIRRKAVKPGGFTYPYTVFKMSAAIGLPRDTLSRILDEEMR